MIISLHLRRQLWRSRVDFAAEKNWPLGSQLQNVFGYHYRRKTRLQLKTLIGSCRHAALTLTDVPLQTGCLKFNTDGTLQTGCLKFNTDGPLLTGWFNTDGPLQTRCFNTDGPLQTRCFNTDGPLQTRCFNTDGPLQTRCFNTDGPLQT